MKKHIRIMLASVCAFAMVGAFALIGCSSNTEQQAGETQKPAEEQAKSESHEAVELQLFAANSLSKAMDAVQELYTQDHTWVTFKDTQYLSSGELNEQLAARQARRQASPVTSVWREPEISPLSGVMNVLLPS